MLCVFDYLHAHNVKASIRSGVRRFEQAAWQVPRREFEIVDEKGGAVQGEIHFPRESAVTFSRTVSSSLREYGA